MVRKYYLIHQVPDLTLSKYSALDNGDVSGVIKAHSHFWRQINRKGLLNGEAFHLFYEYDPRRTTGSKLRIGICIDSATDEDTFVEETIAASPISPYFELIGTNAASNRMPDIARRYRYGTHLIKKERFLSAKGFGGETYYLTSEWEMNDNARLYTMAKLMASIDQACVYIVSVYPRELTADLSDKLDKTLYELRNATRPQFNKSSDSVGIQSKDEHAKSALDFYENLLEALSENPHFLVDVQVLSDNLQHACAILDAATSEALQEGSHEQVQYEQNLSLSEICEASFFPCASASAPKALDLLPQLFLLDELSHFAILPVLYPGEWIEIAKETVPEDHESGLPLGVDETGHKVFFPLKNLSKHAFLAGVPGSGKTNSMMHLIGAMHGTYRIPVLIFEPAKHEYRAITCVEGLEDIELFSPSASTRFPLHINPFEFPAGMTLAEHIRNLIAVFDGAFHLEGPMPFLLDSSVEEVYADMGWIPAMVNMNRLEYPTMSQLYNKLAEKLEKTDYGPDTKGTLKSALQVRIGSLISREMADIFDVPRSSVKPEDWLMRSAIIELESLGRDPANFTTLLIATLIRETLKIKNYVKPPDGRPRHVMFFEEAHNLIGPNAEQTAGLDADPKVAATAYIVKMLAEVRALGEGIVIADQLPTAMAPEVLKNTSLKIALRITAQDDRQLLGGTMNANPDQLENLSIFSPGHAIVSYEPLLKPFEVQLPYFTAKEGDLSDKAILTSMVQSPRYIDNIRTSLAISKAKWQQTEKQLRERLKDARTKLDQAHEWEAKSQSSQDIAEGRRQLKAFREAIDALQQIKKEAARCSLQAIAFQSSFRFLQLNRFIRHVPGVRDFFIELLSAIRDAEKLIDDVYAVLNHYRTAAGKPALEPNLYQDQKQLFMLSAKAWSDL